MGYNFLVKKQNWSNTYKLVNNTFYNCLQATTIGIKATNKCINRDIVKLECQIQTITSQVLHLYARCLKYRLILKALSIGHSYLALWITINPLDLKCLLVFELACVPLSSVINQTAFKKIQDHEQQ